MVGLGAFAPGPGRAQPLRRRLAGRQRLESVEARELARQHFGGNSSSAIQVVIRSTNGPVTEGEGRDVLAKVISILEGEPRIADVIAPMPGAAISQDGSTAIVLAGAGGDANEMVRVATDLKQELQDLSTGTVDVNPTGSSLLWSASCHERYCPQWVFSSSRSPYTCKG